MTIQEAIVKYGDRDGTVQAIEDDGFRCVGQHGGKGGWRVSDERLEYVDHYGAIFAVADGNRTTPDARRDLYNALCDELTNRGIDYRKPDVFGFVAGCWPTDSDATQLADDWIEANQRKGA